MIIKILIPVIIVVIFIIFSREIISFFKEKQRLPYKRKDFLLNVPERKFFEELQKIIPNEYVVFPQVLLSSIVETNNLKDRKEFWKYHNKINRKTIDFVVFEKQYLKPIIAIEYDGKTHNRANRKKNDEKKDEILEISGIKIIRVKHSQDVDFEKLKNTIKRVISCSYK